MKAIRIKTVSQLYLLKQMNPYLGKYKVPKEVIRKMFHILYSKKLGKDGFLILCLNRIEDDYYGIEDAAAVYPNKIWLEETMNVIPTRNKKGKRRDWYIAYLTVNAQKIQILYTTKDQSDDRREQE